ncbi:MAG: hypothetical protein J6R74_06930, partial [Tidjanibacter sp.]|nr:hypothetical protein [Tidjanibacter sp.]
MSVLDTMWRRIKGVPYKKRVLIITVAMIIGSASLLFTTRMSRMLQQKEKNPMRLWSYAMERMGESYHNDPIVFQVVHNQKIPFI